MNPKDCLGNSIEMGDIVAFTKSARSSMIEIGVVSGCSDSNLTILRPNGTNKPNTTNIGVTNTGHIFGRVAKYNLPYKSPINNGMDKQIIELSEELKGLPWPVKKKTVSTQSPVDKWVRTFRKRSEDFTIQYSHSLSKMKGFKFKFSTSHNNKTIHTSVDIQKNTQGPVRTEIFISKSASYWYNCSASYLNNVSSPTRLTTPEKIFGLDFFNESKVLEAIQEAEERVFNQK